MTRMLRASLLMTIAFLALIQLVPYGRDHTNPSKRVEPAWNSPETRALARRACFDCHSNETVWPWYSHVAPASWLVQRDVDHGREHLNFSEFDRPQDDAHEAAEMVQKGEMPLKYYLPAHPEARLSAGDKAALIDGLQATLGRKGDELEAEGHHEADEAGD